MPISLEQAIEIHAHALKRRSGRKAALKAQEYADALRAAGDDEGQAIWLKVSEVAENLGDELGDADHFGRWRIAGSSARRRRA